MFINRYPEVFARFYDLIYHQLRNSADHDFFLSEMKTTNGKILDIGVGTGRFFMDALKDSRDIYGIDISESMTSVLKDKIDQSNHHRISCQNIVDFSFDFQFDLILAPFRVMMHILEKENQILALNNVYKHLKPGGRFIFDAFIPDLNQLITGIDQRLDFEGEYEPGKTVRRIVSTKPDLVQQLINVSFRFEWEDGQKWRTENWDCPLRFFFRYELEHLIERSHFSEYQIFGDYQRNPLSAKSKEFIVECLKS